MLNEVVSFLLFILQIGAADNAKFRGSISQHAIIFYNVVVIQFCRTLGPVIFRGISKQHIEQLNNLPKSTSFLFMKSHGLRRDYVFHPLETLVFCARMGALFISPHHWIDSRPPYSVACIHQDLNLISRNCNVRMIICNLYLVQDIETIANQPIFSAIHSSQHCLVVINKFYKQPMRCLVVTNKFYKQPMRWFQDLSDTL